MKGNDIIPRGGKTARPKGEALGGPDKKKNGTLRDYLYKFALMLIVFFIVYLGKELIFPAKRYLKTIEPEKVYTQVAIDEIRETIGTENELYVSNIVASLNAAPALLTWMLIPERRQEHTYRLWSVQYVEGIKSGATIERNEDSAWIDTPPSMTLEQGMAAMERLRPRLSELRGALPERVLARGNELNMNIIGKDSYGDAEGPGPIAPDAVTLTLTGDKLTVGDGISDADMTDGTFYVYSRFLLDESGNEKPPRPDPTLSEGEPEPYDPKAPKGTELVAIVLLK